MTGTMRNKPAKCCCDPGICLIQSNDLDSDADLDDNFTLSDGDYFSYHEAPFEAIQISNASETATANTPHPQSPYPPRVQIEFYGDNIGSQVRIILGGAIVVQVTVGDGTSDLDILDASDDSELTDTLACAGIDRNEWHRLTVCYDPDTDVVVATIYSLGDGAETYYLSCEYSGSVLDATATFGTGPAHVDNVYVRNFRFWRLWYCGDAPYTSDCPDSDDYYYDPPTRRYCYFCEIPCSLCDQGTTPRMLRFRWTDVDTPQTPPINWTEIYTYTQAWHTVEQNRYWRFNVFVGWQEYRNPCYYGLKDSSYYALYIGMGDSYCPAIVIEANVVKFYGFYHELFEKWDYGQVSIAESPFDCSDILDGLEIPMSQRSFFTESDTITANDASTFTVAYDWSYLISGRILAVFNTGAGSDEFYTVASTSGTGPTIITVVETIPGDRTGMAIRKWATLQLEVIE